MRKLLLLILFSAAPLFADGTSTFNFTSDGLGDIGKTDVFTAGSFSLIATGYSATKTTTDLFAKNGGLTEVGVGLANEIDQEIAGREFIQLDLAKILAASPTAITLGINSIQDGESYDVWGSNTAGVLGTLIAGGQTSRTFSLTGDKFEFISVTAGGEDGGNVLIQNLTVATPEGASTAAFLLMGLGALGVLTVKRKASP